MKAITLTFILCHVNTNAFNPWGHVSYSTTRTNRKIPPKASHLLKNEERSQYHHHRHHLLSTRKYAGKEESENENGNKSQESFQPNKPISLPSLENPPDAGPLYNTCRSVTGAEQETYEDSLQSEGQKEKDSNDAAAANDDGFSFVPNKPIQLESLKGQEDIDRSFFGIQPRTEDESEVPLLMDTGLGVFTNSLILGGSIYLLIAAFIDADIF